MITIPSKTTLYNRLITAFQSTFGITLPTWGQNVLRVISLVLSGEFKQQYRAIASLQKNIWVDTADADMVLRFGFVKLGRFPYPATQGKYTVAVTGLSGAVVPAQTTFLSNTGSLNANVLYILDNSYTMPGTTGYITLRALVAGTGGRLNIGNILTSTSPIINVNSTVTVFSEVLVPNDAETIEQYRAKVLASFQLQPSGDNAISYREEGSLNINGVQQIYPYATSGASNEVTIYIEAIPADSTDGHGTPTSTIISDVTAAIEAARPLGVFHVTYNPITLKQVDININMTGYTPLTASQVSIVSAALNQFIATVRPFIAAADTLSSRNDRLGIFNIGPAISEAIPVIPFGAITFKINGTLQTDYTFDLGAIPFLNSVTYV